MNKRKNDTFITVGRVPPCDIVLQHPSVSRHHLILQYGTLNEGPGWYLYDMGSTHGSKLNKAALPKKFYKRMPVGSLFKVAGALALSHLHVQVLFRKLKIVRAHGTRRERNGGHAIG